MKYKQIRVHVSEAAHKDLTEKAKAFKITLAQFAGIRLNGFEIRKVAQ